MSAVPSTLNLQPSTDLSCKTDCPKPSGDVISLRHETEADGTPISESARCGFGKKPKRPEPKFNQNHFAQLQLLSLTKNSCKLAVKAEID